MAGDLSEATTDIPIGIDVFLPRARANVEAEVGQKFDTFLAIKCATRGTDIFVKVQVTVDGACIHLRLSQPSPDTGEEMKLCAHLGSLTRDDPLSIF